MSPSQAERIYVAKVVKFRFRQFAVMASWGGNQTFAANCTKVSFAESILSTDTSYSGDAPPLSDLETS